MEKETTAEYLSYLEDSIKYGFIHNIQYQHTGYAPKLLLNDGATGQTVLTDIQNELKKANTFCWNVAFVTEAGIAMIKSQILDFARRGGQGRILISPYLGFNSPKALTELLKLPNIQVRMTKAELNSHAKLYLFDHGLEKAIIIGSSNLTHNALKLNYEWNIKLSSAQDGDFIQRAQAAFNQIWEQSDLLDPILIEQYAKQIFKPTVFSKDILQEKQVEYQRQIQPNRMQREALKGIAQLRKQGAKKALVISATGTGKTYLSAFDVRSYRPNRFIFIVHREQILAKAKADYQKVIGFRDEEACIYRSGQDLSSYRYVFATIQSLSRMENLNKIDPTWFDYILIDEVHKAGAPTYQKVMNYFKPNFILGMTATPERTDGQNIYELFDYQVAYEIRLQDALKEEMLCPFLYFGVTDILVDGHAVDEETSFADLTSHARVQHILDKVTYYGHAGDQVKGLIFCANKAEAKEISHQLNGYGYRTIALTGDDSQLVRQQRVNELETGKLDYILTVDIFNEGIDIPSINQVVLLRNTESSIIFVQQLGRGLRKHPSKDFVTIIDFIGNYRNNYLIPVALFGDQSMNKDNYRRELVNRNQLMGLTTINFEEIASKQIFDSINRANLTNLQIYREAYHELANRLGRVPLLTDYMQQNSLDPVVFFEKGYGHYGQLLSKFGITDYQFEQDYGDKVLTFLAKELLEGKRPHDILLLQQLKACGGHLNRQKFWHDLQVDGLYVDDKIQNAVENFVSLSFFKEADQLKYGQEILLMNHEDYYLSPELLNCLTIPAFAVLFDDCLQAGLLRSKRYRAGYQQDQIEIGQKYSRKDACRLLGWERDESSTMYGYKTKHGTTPIFVTYHKREDISQSTQYGDEFINEQIFHWYTRSRRHLESKEVVEIVNHQTNGNQIHLFVKKEDGEGRDFYYLGPVSLVPDSAQNSQMFDKGQPVSVVTMDLKLSHPMTYDLYHYLVEA
ncbi:DEAD/DEAH box helicase [Vaginisenegalia massiliensis]|uniref:DEAD/DEAH box helicase n=1 Tax=Vaginisenegalia massiliensis TaxID=2058294 RepID=UPI000F51EF56|nr:DEAD/DEAH box helicase [Vaginisenegalia massiliensis]